MKSNNENIINALKKLLRTYIMKGVSYVQGMLDVLTDTESVSVEEAKLKLAVEKDRFSKKNYEIALRRKKEMQMIKS